MPDQNRVAAKPTPNTPITVDNPSEPTPYSLFRLLRGVFEDDWRSRPTPTRPWPVVLLHGTGQSKSCWQELGAELRKDGWCVFAPDYGTRATSAISESLEQLSAYLRVVLAATEAEKLILVGHSQGGLLATLLSVRMSKSIKHVVCLAAPNHGTNLGGVAAGLSKFPGTRYLMENFVESFWGASGMQQLTGSEMVLDPEGVDTIGPGVTYTCIATKHDQLINPLSSCFLDDGGTGQVRNFRVQDQFPQAVVLHEQMVNDHRVRMLVREDLSALARKSDKNGA